LQRRRGRGWPGGRRRGATWLLLAGGGGGHKGGWGDSLTRWEGRRGAQGHTQATRHLRSRMTVEAEASLSLCPPQTVFISCTPHIHATDVREGCSTIQTLKTPQQLQLARRRVTTTVAHSAAFDAGQTQKLLNTHTHTHTPMCVRHHHNTSTSCAITNNYSPSNQAPRP
jgi:hypothetical protein